jgi:hypothetical protein
MRDWLKVSVLTLAIAGGFGLALLQSNTPVKAIAFDTPVPVACQWNYSFDAAGNSLATFCSNTRVGGTAYNTPVAIAALPTCNVDNVGAMDWVSNGKAAPTYHLVVSTTGTNVWPVFCTYDGATYAWRY